MEPRQESKRRFRIEKLEERIASSHLGHEVLLPPAAAHGEGGIEVANAAPQAPHTRDHRLILE